MKLNRRFFSASSARGFTLIELIIVIAVLGILSGIAAPRVAAAVETAKMTADTASLRVLNGATMYYKASLQISSADVFEGLSNDTDRLQQLVDTGFLSSIPEPRVKDASFVWSTDGQKWLSTHLLLAEDLQTRYIFSNESLSDFTYTNSWAKSNDGFYSSYGRLFIENPSETYTLTASVSLAEGTNGGYGIFFETSVAEDLSDTGYVLQFDRGIGSGAIIIRPRAAGYEFGYLNDYVYNSSNSALIYDKNTPEGAAWWAEEHSLTLSVEKVPDTTDQKKLSVYIDGELLFDDFQFESTLEPENNYTGFRSWHQTATYHSLDIE